MKPEPIGVRQICFHQAAQPRPSRDLLGDLVSGTLVTASQQTFAKANTIWRKEEVKAP